MLNDIITALQKNQEENICIEVKKKSFLMNRTLFIKNNINPG